MDIDLRANGLRIRIGMLLDERDLGSARVSKAGFFTGLYLRKTKQAGDVVYWAKNPNLQFFEGKITANPDRSNHTALRFRAARSRMDADQLFGTSLFLYFNGGHLRLAVAQVIMSFTWAQCLTNDFRERSVASFGDAASSDLSSVPVLKGISSRRQIHLRCSWGDAHEFLISELASQGDRARIFWGVGQPITCQICHLLKSYRTITIDPHSVQARTFSGMERLANAARTATAMMVMFELGLDETTTQEQQVEIATHLRARCSILFDIPPDPQHERLNLITERQAAFGWLAHQAVFKELVVQTLRVQNTLEYAKTGSAPDPVIGVEVLTRFGKDVPQGPDPDNYQALLSRAMHSMPEHLQPKMVQWLAEQSK